MTQTPEQYAYFMRKTGLFDLLRDNTTCCLYDYVMGIEAGLYACEEREDTKCQMERLVESYIRKTGLPYARETTTQELRQHISLPADFAPNKRWDFAVITPCCVYAIETNFYTDGGSKLNETARSYKKLAEEARNIEGFSFVWITDGKGWSGAKHNLMETFNALETTYNIADMENGIFQYLLR